LTESPGRHTNDDGEQEPYTRESIPATTMTTRHAMIPSVHWTVMMAYSIIAMRMTNTIQHLWPIWQRHFIYYRDN